MYHIKKMFPTKNISKKISFLLLISIFFINFSFLSIPKKTEADSVSDILDGIGMALDGLGIVTDVGGLAPSFLLNVNTPKLNLENKKRDMLDTLKNITVDLAIATLKKIAITLIGDITSQTVQWIGGFGEGEVMPPRYSVDIGQTLKEAADSVVGDYLYNSENFQFLCEPFKAEIQLALGFNAGLGKGNLFQGSNCSLTDVIENVKNGVDLSVITFAGVDDTLAISKNSFTSSGGWDSWIALTTNPQNNIQGAYIIAENDLSVKIQTAKSSVSNEILSGSGALSLKSCVNTYKDNISGNLVGPSEGRGPYIQGTEEPPPPEGIREGLIDGRYSVERVCDIKTPGAIITGMLDKSVNADRNMSELTAALGNGVDLILNELVDAILKSATDMLTRGVFDDSTIENRARISSLASQRLDEIKDEADSQINNGDGSNPLQNKCLDVNALNYLVGNLPCVYPEGYVVPEGLIDNSDNFVIGYGYLAQAQNNALILLNSLSKSEFEYRNNFEITKNILTEAQKVFATSSVCNLNMNSFDSVLRAMLIRANVITNIDGTPDSNRNIANIPWNLQIIDTAIKDSNDNQIILDKAALDVRSASSLENITIAMTPVNSTSFNTDPQETMIDNVKTWLRGVQAMYNSPICPIDITQVLEINSSTSTIQ